MRQKLIDAIEAKVLHEKKTFDMVKNGNQFLSTKKRRTDTAYQVMEGTRFYYTHFERYPEGDGSQFYEMFSGVDTNIMFLALEALVDDEGNLIDDNIDMLKDHAYEYAECFGMEFDDEEEMCDFIDECVAFAQAVDNAVHGRTDEAMKCDNFVAYASEMLDFYDDLINHDYMMKNIGYFSAIIYPHSSTVRATVIGSDDLYEYSLYKDKLPKRIREDVDRMIAIYERPFCDSVEGLMFRDSYLDAEKKKHIQVMVYEGDPDKCSCFVDDEYHPLYLTSVKWLMRELPKLKEKYGACESTLRLFFLLFSLIFRVFSAIISISFFYFPVSSTLGEPMHKSTGSVVNL